MYQLITETESLQINHGIFTDLESAMDYLTAFTYELPIDETITKIEIKEVAQ